MGDHHAVLERPTTADRRRARTGYGFHHWAVISDDFDADLARFGHPVVYEDQTPSGARLAYADATATLPGFIELLELQPQQERAFQKLYDASQDWDGSDPVREG